jgi:hypothetical protein
MEGHGGMTPLPAVVPFARQSELQTGLRPGKVNRRLHLLDSPLIQINASAR